MRDARKTGITHFLVRSRVLHASIFRNVHHRLPVGGVLQMTGAPIDGITVYLDAAAAMPYFIPIHNP